MRAGNRLHTALLWWALGTFTPLQAAPVPQGLSPLQAIELIFNNQTAGLVNSLNAMKAQLASQGIALNAYNLDAPDVLRHALNVDLPADPAQAKALVLQRLNQIGVEGLRERYQAAYQAQSKSVQYGLERFPAWVFNHGQAVIYGDIELNSALQHFQQHLQSSVGGH